MAEILRQSVKRIVITEDEDLGLDALLIGDSRLGQSASNEERKVCHVETSSSPLSDAANVVDTSPILQGKPSVRTPISAVEDAEDDEVCDWVNPPPAVPGEYLSSSLHKVPSKSILKKTSSYGHFAMDSSSSSFKQTMIKKPSFLSFMELSSTSVRSQCSSRKIPHPSSPSSIGWDLESSSGSQDSVMSKNKTANIPHLLAPTADHSADHALGMVPIDPSAHSAKNSMVSSPKMRRSVSFDSVAIREYDRTIGDNPRYVSGRNLPN